MSACYHSEEAFVFKCRTHGMVLLLSERRTRAEELQIAQAFANNGAKVCEQNPNSSPYLQSRQPHSFYRHHREAQGRPGHRRQHARQGARAPQRQDDPRRRRHHGQGRARGARARGVQVRAARRRAREQRGRVPRVEHGREGRRERAGAAEGAVGGGPEGLGRHVQDQRHRVSGAHHIIITSLSWP